MNKEHVNEIQGLLVLAFGLILLTSFLSFTPDDLSWFTSHPHRPVHNWIRFVGAYTAGTLFFVFGRSAFFFVAFLLFWSWNKFTSREIPFNAGKFFSAGVLFCVLAALGSMISLDDPVIAFHHGGLIGYALAHFLAVNLGVMGAYIILGTLAAMTLIVTGEFLLSPIFFRLWNGVREGIAGLRDAWRERSSRQGRRSASAVRERTARPFRSTVRPSKKGRPPEPEEEEDEDIEEEPVEEEEEGTAEGPRIRVIGPRPSELPPPTPAPVEASEGTYRLPSLELLTPPPVVADDKVQSDLARGARTLETALEEFGVAVRVADIERGPVITRYELEPGPGVKVNKITSLQDDIALTMRAPAVRIVAPIPGKNRVGIEVPNSSTAAVYLRDVLSESRFRESRSKLMLAIGKDISGRPLIADLAEMPHLLIAGTTGAGKTVCINSLVMSMLFNATPSEVRFLMVDPKMVELVQYNELPHMLCPAVTDAKKVTSALQWVVGEMESRYTMLSKAGVRNIKAYHALGHALPYIIIIIDELADLMQVSAKTIESAITRLAQLSRAVGIHLILATQRPSVDVITGVIKANFPARISFKVASKVDSRTVLDMNGAETLLGKGDLLFIKPGDAKPTRGQCSYVSDEEVLRVIDFIKNQQDPTYDETILSHQKSGAGAGGAEKDDLYDEAVRLVIETNQASVSILQRRMRLGYTRAARLIDLMEQDGLVGPYCGSKPREILVDRESWLMEHAYKEEETSHD